MERRHTDVMKEYGDCEMAVVGAGDMIEKKGRESRLFIAEALCQEHLDREE